MLRSTERILTTHVGSLPRPDELIRLLQARQFGEPESDEGKLMEACKASIAGVVGRQKKIGIDFINDGEHSKISFSSYAQLRLSGLAPNPEKAGFRGETRDSAAFAAVYKELGEIYGARVKQRGFPRPMANMACVGPIKFIGEAQVDSDIAMLSAALGDTPREHAFMTAISPTNLELYYPNRYYNSDEEYLAALSEAMNQEYRRIVDAGFLLQIDDPRLITHYNRSPGIDLAENRRFIAQRVEALNYSLKGIPEEKVRFHTCYSVNVAPRVHDLELRHYVDQMFEIKAQAYSIEASNPRHEHEWQVFEEARLPAGKILVPGVVTHCSTIVEHPELVAQRLVRFARVVGRENVIASNDCGFATSAAGDEVHADVGWAKLEALVEGANIATKVLWG
ncbi:MAG: cobalamin-independent methionine synthase II family protein [Beijerinckiaceae bacterium]